MPNGAYQTLEEKLGIVTGILQNIPGQIDQLFTKLNDEIRDQSALHAVANTKLEQLDRDINKTCARDRSNCPYYERFKKSHDMERDVKDLLELEKVTKESNLFQSLKELKEFKEDYEKSGRDQTLKDLVDFKNKIEVNRSFFKKHAAMIITSVISGVTGSVAAYFVLRWLGKGG